MAKAKLKVIPQPKLLKLDLGCGKNKLAGYEGVDVRDFPGVDHVCDLRDPWPWANESVEAVHCSHFLEHLEGLDRAHFMNELWRVLIPGGKATIITPHWASSRAYGDLTHKWPPVGEMFYYYVKKDWREANAPHLCETLTCDFEATWGYGMRQDLHVRNQEYQMFALSNYKEAATDLIATLTKPVVKP